MAAIKLENARLLEEMIEKKRMERELELAGEIQQNLLPSGAPKVSGWDLIGHEHALLHDRRGLLTISSIGPGDSPSRSETSPAKARAPRS